MTAGWWHSHSYQVLVFCSLGKTRMQLQASPTSLSPSNFLHGFVQFSSCSPVQSSSSRNSLRGIIPSANGQQLLSEAKIPTYHFPIGFIALLLRNGGIFEDNGIAQNIVWVTSSFSNTKVQKHVIALLSNINFREWLNPVRMIHTEIDNDRLHITIVTHVRIVKIRIRVEF